MNQNQISLGEKIIFILAGTAAAVIFFFFGIEYLFAADKNDVTAADGTAFLYEEKGTGETGNEEPVHLGENAPTGEVVTPTSEPIPDTTVRICMVGDLLLSQAVNDTCNDGEGNYDYNILFENVSQRLQNYDLRIINEETACGGTEYGISGYPSFNSPHSAQDAVANAGFNCVLLATNHMLDLGLDPMFSTVNYWNSVYPDIRTIGAYSSEEASNSITVYEKEGFRIAVLNYTYGSNGGDGSYYGVPWALDMLNEDDVYQDVLTAKSISDYVIVCPHWGTEMNGGIDEMQNYWASHFLEWGVDMVIGTHPHVIEPIELRTDDNGHQMIVFYSLGNFVSNQDDAAALVGGMADITLRKTADGTVSVYDFGVIPIVTHKSNYFTAYFLADYSQDMIDQSSSAIIDPEFSYEYCENLVNSVFGDRIRQ